MAVRICKLHQVCLSKCLVRAVRDNNTLTRACDSACRSLLDVCTPHVRHLAASQLLRILSCSSHIKQHHNSGCTYGACLQICRSVLQADHASKRASCHLVPLHDHPQRMLQAEQAQHRLLQASRSTPIFGLSSTHSISASISAITYFLIPRTGLSISDHLLHQTCCKAATLWRRKQRIDGSCSLQSAKA